jgi:hypothetical protein
LTDETPGQWEPAAIKAPPLEGPTTHALTLGDVSGHSADPDVNIAYRWSKLYAKDIEYEPFFNWIGRRSNPERTDFKQILESVPMQWGPEDLPPPLRRFFLQRFSK